jgi:hypothetical protein
MTTDDPIFSIRASAVKINVTGNHEQRGLRVMNPSFLTSLMQVALQQTGADRAMVCDTNMAIVASVKLEPEDILSEQLTDFLRKAMETGEPVVTNNAVKEPTQAPNTKTNYDNLRGVVVIPVSGHGALYLDRPLKQGIIAKSVVNKLVKLARQTAQNTQTETTESSLQELFQQIS